MADASENKLNGVQEIEVDGYKFTVDTDLLDDVDSLDYIDRIESRGHVAAILPLLKFILGGDEFNKMRTYFTEKDAADHAKETANDKKDPNAKPYKARMRMEKLNDVYMAIIEKFDPKG